MPDTPRCVYCGQDSSQAPLIPFRYQDEQVWICAQHLPILIHRPDQLAGILPGLENVASSEGHDH